MSAVRPEFIRLPQPSKKGQPRSFCPHTGYSRSSLYILTVPCKANGFRPAVPAKCDRKRGKLRGIWLIPYEPLIAHIKALPTGLELHEKESAGSSDAGKVEAGQPAGASRSGRSARSARK